MSDEPEAASEVGTYPPTVEARVDAINSRFGPEPIVGATEVE